MPVTIKTAEIKYKDSNGQYVGLNGVAERATSEQIEEITQKGEETRASIPSDYTALSDQVACLDTAIKRHGTRLVPLTKISAGTSAGITYTYAGDNTYNVSGNNTTGVSFYNAYNPTLEEVGVSVGEYIYIYAETTHPNNTYMQLWWVDANKNMTYVRDLKNEYVSYKIPTGCAKLLYRIYSPRDAGQFSGKIKAEILTKSDNDNYVNFKLRPQNESLPDNTNLDTITENGVWLLNSEFTYTGIPSKMVGAAGFLYSFINGNQAFQILIYYPSSISYIWMRVNNLNTSNGWRNWSETASSLFGVSSDIYAITYDPDSSIYQQTTVDLNNVIHQNKIWLCADSITFTNGPVGWNGIGFLHCIFSGNWHLQLIYPFSGNKLYKRRGNASGSTWETWQELGGSGNTYNVTNEYEFPAYSQSVTLTASPTITTDTNNYLASTGDTTDRTSDILTMLTASKVCRLGPGKYYINGLQMPDGSSIIGSGYATEVYLSGTSDGYAIKLGSYCTVKDFQLLGATSDISLSASKYSSSSTYAVNDQVLYASNWYKCTTAISTAEAWNPSHWTQLNKRHGLLWQGTYSSDNQAPARSMVSNVYIRRFTGGGIRCYNTGYGTSNALEVTNVYVWNCMAGIDIAYWSEFHKFTNVRSGQCLIGCINNGGNNLFTNCDFSSNLEIAMLMDNSQGQSPNNTHGSAIGCVFNHTASGGTSNSGIGIEILNCESGFVFEGCQIFFSKLHFLDSDGILVANCNFGLSNCNIIVENGGAILFNGNMHQGQPTISISGNQNVKFANCYVRSTGAVVPA